MKKITHILLAAAMLFAAGGASARPDSEAPAETNANEGKVVMLSKADFLKKVWNYEKNEEWVYEGKLPCIIDFYADWCGPCRRVSPILAELAKEYSGKIIVYKIDTEKEKELAAAFGIQSIPFFLFVPAKGQPESLKGAYPRESYVKIINEFLLKKEAK